MTKKEEILNRLAALEAEGGWHFRLSWTDHDEECFMIGTPKDFLETIRVFVKPENSYEYKIEWWRD